MSDKIIDLSKVLTEIRETLKANIDEKTKNGFQRYFKEPVIFYGVKSAIVKKISKEYFKKLKSANFKKRELFILSEKLFKSGYSEEAWIAASFIYWYDRFEKKDFTVYEYFIDKYIDNWAKCDNFCNHAVGSFIEIYPEYIRNLKSWAKSKNLWLRRASAVSLILPARKGKFLKDILEIADILLKDTKDMVQKGYGWMLKEASRKHQKEIFAYVIENKKTMPRTALRYAIEKMPKELKIQAMKR